jgi:hypothetical protein
VTITGDAPTNARTGSWITLLSYAFASRDTIDGVPVVRTQVFADGTYRATAQIQSGLRHTYYAIDGSYDGHSLAQVAWLHLR